MYIFKIQNSLISLFRSSRTRKNAYKAKGSKVCQGRCFFRARKVKVEQELV